MAVRPSLQTTAYRLTEEVVRWRLELEFQATDEWWIAFTNPTAGPWKRLMGRDQDGREGEVYRFPREEARPDIVAVSDVRQMVLIIEAKDAIDKLMRLDQARKSARVVLDLARKLGSIRRNPFWADRAGYTVVAGLLWGHPHNTAQSSWRAAFDVYRPFLDGIPLSGFETQQDEGGNLGVCEYIEDSFGFGPLLARLTDT